MSVFEFTAKVSNKNFNYPLSFATRPALQLRKVGLSFRPNFSSLLFFKQKKENQNSKSLCRRCCRIIRRKEYNIYLYSFILYVYITFVISIRAREENPIGDIICVEFSSFEKPLRGF